MIKKTNFDYRNALKYNYVGINLKACLNKISLNLMLTS